MMTFREENQKRLLRFRRARARLVRALDRHGLIPPGVAVGPDTCMVATKDGRRVAYITFRGLRQLWRRRFPKREVK